MKRLYMLGLLCSALCTLSLPAQRIETVSVRSEKMNREIPNTVILPEGYATDTTRNYPVIYLLHGCGDNYRTWAERTKTDLPQIASDKGIIFVCPDGEKSWYWDSPLRPESQFETYVSKELVEAIDNLYRTIPDRTARAIAGFSMGGHGALWLSIHHPDTYGAVGSMSGGADIRPFPKSWEMSKQIGDYRKNKKRWNAHTVINRIPELKNGELEIIIDCGYDDFFFKVNERLHKALIKRGIMHDYIVRPGAHTHPYWNNAVDFQILFFEKYFKKNKNL